MKFHKQLDAAIIEGISNGRNTFDELARGEPLVRFPSRWGNSNTDRVIDRRLQALRKAGKIVFKHGCWHIEGKV